MSNAAIAIAPASEQQSDVIDFKQNIHYLRGIAALAVMLFHSGHYFAVSYESNLFRSIFPNAYGIYGVAIFFAISGYLMAELIERQPPFEFLLRRVIRIYPAMIIATAVVLATSSAIYLAQYQLVSTTLVPIGRTTYALGVEWTLVNEMFFYVVLFLLSCAGLKQYVVPAAIAWALAILFNAYFATSFPAIGKANIVELPLMTANFGFAVGLLIPTLVKRGNFSLILLCIFLASIFVSFVVPASFVRIVAGLGSACLVAASISNSVSLPKRLAQLLNKMGDWSYALYLVHVPIFTTLFRLRPESISIYLIYCVAIVLALSAAAFLGSIDLAIAGRSKRLIQPANRQRIIMSGAVFIAFYVSLSVFALLW